MPSVMSAMGTLPLKLPIKKLFATGLRLIVTVVLAPALKLPEVEETVSQLEMLTRLQFKDFEPTFFSVLVWEVTENGPPPGPKAVKPSGGVMRRLSNGGDRSAGIRLAPLGVPKPVQRS